MEVVRTSTESNDHGAVSIASSPRCIGSQRPGGCAYDHQPQHRVPQFAADDRPLPTYGYQLPIG